MTKQLKPCLCGYEQIARSHNSTQVTLFCPSCGRFVEAKNSREAAALWNSNVPKKDEGSFVLTNKN